MQAWVDAHPALFGVADLLLVYVAVSLVVHWWSGWGELTRCFRSQGRFSGPRWRFQSGQMRRLCGYGNCLTIGATSGGLYLATIPLFPLFHPALFIPWQEISFARRRQFFVAGVRYELGREMRVPLWVRERLAEQIRVAAGSAYPVETLE